MAKSTATVLSISLNSRRAVQGNVDRQTAVVMGVAALSVVAVGLAAATLSSAVSSGDGSGSGASGAVDMPVNPGSGVGVGDPFLVQVIAVLAGVALLSVYAYTMLEPRKVLYFALLFGGILVVGYLLLSVLSTGDPITPQSGEQPTVNTGMEGNGSGGSGTDGAAPSAPTTMLVTLLGVVGVVLFVALAFFSDSVGGIGRSESNAEPDTDRSAEIGEIAGRAADRIDAATDTVTHNEVYRAWEEMVEHLDVDDPDSTTPGEFASAAVDAGMQQEDVTDLTRLFEDVRYGGQDPTDSREQQAREILRRIERRYTNNE
ncbi:DUF4129 domain-containing protein [Halovenus marina]|uniref:DUF4129 domain-containing protein n=1 Tax=Halovenus marina TaxID=3396621 RepID=UPI003F54A784